MVRKAGCVPVRQTDDGSWEVLLVESRWTDGLWVFPKGAVEKGEKAKEAAVRETREEAGVEGILGEKLGSWPVRRKGDDYSRKVTLKMWVLDIRKVYGPRSKEWKERKTRGRRWFTLEHARQIMRQEKEARKRPELLEVLDAAREALAARLGPGVPSFVESDSDFAEQEDADEYFLQSSETD